MKTQKYHFILAIWIGILCVAAPGAVELPRPAESVLLGRANPALGEIDKLGVSIVPPGAEPNKNGLVFKELKAKVKNKLKETGIKIDFRIAGRISNIPELRVDIDMLKLDDSQRYVFRIQTSLARTVVLPIQRSVHLKTDVWKVESAIQAVSVQDMSQKVADVVLEQVETFINCHLIANRNGVQPANANGVSTAPQKWAKPAVKPELAKYRYVASKNSKVFHKPECHWARRILPKNLVGYKSREEAIEAGKRPCKQCKP